MVNATFLIKFGNPESPKYTSASGNFDDKADALQKAFGYARVPGNTECICYINGDENPHVARKIDFTF